MAAPLQAYLRVGYVGEMEARRIGGGLLVAVSVGVQVITQAMGLHLSQGMGGAPLIACAVAGLAGLILTLWSGEKCEVRPMTGDAYNNHGNNFGHMGPVNIGRQRYELTDAALQEIVAAALRMGTASITAIGSARSLAIGEHIVRVLNARGVKTTYTSIGSLMPPPSDPLEIITSAGTAYITIAADI